MAFSYALRKTATVWNMSGSCRPAGLGGKEIDHSSMAGTFDFSSHCGWRDMTLHGG
jgi:hypothetical protein